jgi:hypothetical protein
MTKERAAKLLLDSCMQACILRAHGSGRGWTMDDKAGHAYTQDDRSSGHVKEDRLGIWLRHSVSQNATTEYQHHGQTPRGRQSSVAHICLTISYT